MTNPVKNSLKKSLLLTALLAASMASQQACYADVSTTASHNLSAVLGQEIYIETKTGSVVNATIDGDEGFLSNQLTPSFTVSTNSPSNVIVCAQTNTQSGNTPALANKPGGGGQLVVLTNTGFFNPPATAVTNITGGSPVLNQNQDAIAYEFQSATDRSVTPEFKPASQAYNIPIPVGVTNVNDTILVTPITDTFGPYRGASDAVDHFGEYKAVVTCQVGAV